MLNRHSKTKTKACNPKKSTTCGPPLRPSLAAALLLLVWLGIPCSCTKVTIKPAWDSSLKICFGMLWYMLFLHPWCLRPESGWWLALHGFTAKSSIEPRAAQQLTSAGSPPGGSLALFGGSALEIKIPLLLLLALSWWIHWGEQIRASMSSRLRKRRSATCRDPKTMCFEARPALSMTNLAKSFKMLPSKDFCTYLCLRNTILLNSSPCWSCVFLRFVFLRMFFPIGSMYAIYGNIYHHYTPNVSIYTIHGSYGFHWCFFQQKNHQPFFMKSPASSVISGRMVSPAAGSFLSMSSFSKQIKT